MQIRVISETISDVGEGPLFNAHTNVVTWVDITGKRWHQCDFATGITTSHEVPKMIGAIVERTKGGFFAAVEEGFAEVHDRDGYTVVSNFLPQPHRMNDAKADARGRWWAGSNAIDFTAGEGALHRLDAQHNHSPVLSGLTLPNGLGWSPDNTKFYFIDTFAGKLWVFDFDLESGEISNQKIFHDFAGSSGVPDGLCVADDGSVLVAMWDGGRIEVISATGELQSPITLPVSRPTSCTFGGPTGSELIVTTAARELDLAREPMSGKLLGILDTGMTGKSSEKYAG
jgi:sugar lactone lactonase YvrE